MKCLRASFLAFLAATNHISLGHGHLSDQAPQLDSAPRPSLETYLPSALQPDALLSLLEIAANATIISLVGGRESRILPDFQCAICIGLLTTLKAIAEFGEQPLLDTIIAACIASGFQDDDVCRGAVKEEGPAIVQVLRSIDPFGYAGQLVCATIVGACSYPPIIESGMAFPPPATDPKPPSTPNRDVRPLNVLHFSDWHYDPLYVAGTEAQCSKPLCCRGFNSTSPNKAASPAPSWGSYSCDTPLKLGVSMLQSVERTMGGSPDFSIFTGDIPAHDIWLSTPESVVTAESTSYALFHEHLKTNVYAAVGNHETSPVNLFQPISIADPPDNQYLFNNLTAADWTEWLDPDSLAHARTHRGSYATKPMPGLKVISLNSNDCYRDNYWLFAVTSEVDPNGQLAWLARELAASEAVGERVWIVSHVAAGVLDCLRNWSNLHNQIVQRYHKTISGIFSGHTHRDEYELYYTDDADKAPHNAIATGWIAPSVTPFTQINPGWRQYKVDPVTFEILDSITFITDLSLASEWDATGTEPVWFKEYSARDYLPSWPCDAPLNATFWASVTAAFETDDTLFQRFYQYRGKSGPNAAGGCSGECKTHVIDGLKRGYSGAGMKMKSSQTGTGLRLDERDGQSQPWARDLCGLHSYH